MQLDITAGSMSGTPAAAVYNTLLSSAIFVIDYFNYVEVPHFLDEIKMSQLSDKLMAGLQKELLVKTRELVTWQEE